MLYVEKTDQCDLPSFEKWHFFSIEKKRRDSDCFDPKITVLSTKIDISYCLFY